MEIKSETKFKKVSSVAELSAESSVDYTLPDYLGDVRKILYTECEARPSGKFTDEGKVEFSGIAVYNVVYLDSENKPTGVSFTSDYDATVKCPAEELAGVYADPAVTSYNIRLTGPRRFSAKAVIGASAAVVTEDLIAASGSAFDGDGVPETLTRVLNMRATDVSERVEREYADVIERLDGAIADEVQVVYTGSDVVLEGASAGEESATVKGALILYAVVSVPDAPLYFVEKKIPIEETVPFVGVMPEMALIPEGRVVSLVSNVNADETGSEIVISAVVEYAVRGEYNEGVRTVADAFMKTNPTENTYRDYRYTELTECVRVVESMSCEIERSSLPCESLCQVVYLTATPKVEKVSGDGNVLKLEGEMRFSGIASEVCEDGGVAYTGLKFTSPFEKGIKCVGAVPEDVKFELSFTPTVATAIIDAESIEINYTISGNLTLSEPKCASVLTSCDVIGEEKYESSPGRITVYYPESGETLFEIARKFHRSQDSVARDNNIAATTAADGGSVSLAEYKRIYIF